MGPFFARRRASIICTISSVIFCDGYRRRIEFDMVTTSEKIESIDDFDIQYGNDRRKMGSVYVFDSRYVETIFSLSISIKSTGMQEGSGGPKNPFDTIHQRFDISMHRNFLYIQHRLIYTGQHACIRWTMKLRAAR